jgi:hypothetical protein
MVALIGTDEMDGRGLKVMREAEEPEEELDEAFVGTSVKRVAVDLVNHAPIPTISQTIPDRQRGSAREW